MDNSLYLVFVEFNPSKELKYKQNDIDNYNTWLYLRCNKDKPKIAPKNTVAVGFASYDWLFNKGKMLGITIDGKLKMVDLTYRNYKIKPTYKITDGITKRSDFPDNPVYIDNGNHKFTYYELHFMDLKRVTQYWNNIRSNPKKIPRSNLEIELNLCHPNPMPYAYNDLIDTKGPKWASLYKNLIDIKGAEWAGYLADFPIQYCKDYDTLVTMALAKNELYLNPDKGEPSMADGDYTQQPGSADISLMVNGEIRGTFNVDQDWDTTIDLGYYSTHEPSDHIITIKSNGKYIGSFNLNQGFDSTIDIGDSSESVVDLAKALFKVNGETIGSIDFNKQTEYQTVNLDNLKAHDSTVKINYEDTNLGSFTTDQSNDSTIDISGINNLITKPNDNTVTIKANGSDIGSFTLNQNRDTTIDFGNLKPSDSKVSFSLNGNEIGSITLNQTNGSSIAFNGLATTDSVDTKLKTISTMKAYYSKVPEITTIVTKETSSEGTITYHDYTAPKPEGLVLGKDLYRTVNVVKSAGTGNNVAIYTIRYSNPLSYNDTDQYQCVNPSVVATTTDNAGSNINGTAGSFKEVIINTIDNTSFNVQ